MIVRRKVNDSVHSRQKKGQTLRGGISDAERIIYQVAKGETAIIMGSEILGGWKPMGRSVWKVKAPNAPFGDYNRLRLKDDYRRTLAEIDPRLRREIQWHFSEFDKPQKGQIERRSRLGGMLNYYYFK